MFIRKSRCVLDELLLRRVAVNEVDTGNVLFVGRLAKYDGETYVLDQCETYPRPGETAQPIKGRQYIDRIHTFLSELP